jgi:hypothetical protein
MARVDTRRVSALAGAFRHISSVSPPKRQLRRWSSYSRYYTTTPRLIKVLLAPSRPQAMTVLLQATQ